MFTESDPYLIVKCGSMVFNDRENYQLNTKDPEFYKYYEFNVTFPGADIVYIEAYDYDQLFGDDFIGLTKFDLDDRFYSKEWTSIHNKPIEYRNLWILSSNIAQGVVKCWVDIFDVKSGQCHHAPYDITPQPIEEHEMRLIIYRGKGVDAMDWEGTSDVYVRSYVEDEFDCITDTHWRCQNGNPSWNWRNLIKVRSQQPSYKLTIKVMDKDLINDEEIGTFQLDVTPIVNDLIATNMVQVLTKKSWESQYMKDQL